jgi:glutamate dehydrogenase
MVFPGVQHDFSLLMGRLSRFLTDTPTGGPGDGEVMAFARHFLRNAPHRELSALPDADLAGMVGSLHRLVMAPLSGAVRVDVFNPTQTSHGWQSPHTLVQVVCADRPFLVDSVSMELNRRGLFLHLVVAESVFTVRDEAGQVVHLVPGHESATGRKEALLHLETDRLTDPRALAALASAVEAIVAEVAAAVSDFMPMVKRVMQYAESLSIPGNNPPSAEVRECLYWLTGNHFTFLGLREYTRRGEHWVAVPGSALGIAGSARGAGLFPDERPVQSPRVLSFDKAGERSWVHRPVYMDMITLTDLDSDGEPCRMARIVGLFTSSVFNHSPRDFPLIGRKMRAVLELSGLEPASHDGKRLMQILETFPREELFQMSVSELFRVSSAVLHLQYRRRLRLFLRESAQGDFVACLIYAPRDYYTTALRKRFEAVLTRHFDVRDLEFNTYFTEITHARLYILMRLNDGVIPSVDEQQIEAQLAELARPWADGLQEALDAACGPQRAASLFRRYGDAFPSAYCETVSAGQAVADIMGIESLSGVPASLSLRLWREAEDSPDSARFTIIRQGAALELSAVLPVLENLGLRVSVASTWELCDKAGTQYRIHAYAVHDVAGTAIDTDSVRGRFEAAFDAVWAGRAENDGFNRLVMTAGLDWREAGVLRAVAAYCRQIRFPFTADYIQEALAAHPLIVAALIRLFRLRFDPAQADEVAADLWVVRLRGMLDQVASLDEDRILRRYLEVLLAMLRTNFFQPAQALTDHLSFKLSPALVPGMPKPVPVYEIFVYGPRVEGVHLRFGSVARGGLRWSDRREDFRTEVLGLVKAQQVKNAVIVPVGAKGGFYPKRLPRTDQRDAVLAEAIESYRLFIGGLLDITDNLVEGQVVPPDQVLRKDGDDPYLVVAADKGTATFSDIANAVAVARGFWLGDAFASGGSAGYDHKKMGITARGAWVSVRAHFRELGVDVQTQPVTVIGIGDMSGDVFGNGLLLSQAVKLVAAFDHRHVFLDPDPEPGRAFAERQRLFALPRSSWDDYDKALVSAGGGVFPRSAKAIPLTDAVRQLIGTDAAQLTPAELIHGLLKAPVDLIFNGGIGTYVKAAGESHADVGDKANDGLRVNGGDMRARVFAEGGNLGMTQAGRIEFARRGGLCNTDFIDNSAGVDCSDHEVNIKILLNACLTAGELAADERNTLLAAMTDEVAELVLLDNHRQTRCLSLASAGSVYRLGEYRRYLQSLSQAGHLDRALEFIPDDEELGRRMVAGEGLARPELAVLLSTTKVLLKRQLLESSLPEDPALAAELPRAFPALLARRFPRAMAGHKLRREIIATQVANCMVNHMGITFAHRMAEATGASVGEIGLAFIAARNLVDLETRWDAIEACEGLPASEQAALLGDLVRLVRRITRWILRTQRRGVRVDALQTAYRDAMQHLGCQLGNCLPHDQRARLQARTESWRARGLAEDLAAWAARLTHQFPLLAILQVAESSGHEAETVARLYFALGDRLGLDALYHEINTLPVHNHWQALAREGFRDDLEWQQRTLTLALLAQGEGSLPSADAVDRRIAHWVLQQSDFIRRWERVIAEARASEPPELATWGVVLRELMDLAQASLHRQ